MIVLPQKDDKGEQYLSYSQKTKWNRAKSKRDYIRSYFFKEKDTNAALSLYGDFGTKVGEAFENNDFSGFTKKEAEFLKTVPAYDEFEKEVHLHMDDFYVMCFIDSNTSCMTKLLDYKTAIIEKKRADYESDDYDQLDIYCAAIKQKYKKLPKKADVVLIQRDGNAFNGEELTLGEEFVVIPKKITMKRINEVKADINKVAEEISDHYKVFLKLMEIY